jgi:6-phosphogluconolactonase (cycloisomerase 2 family)
MVRSFVGVLAVAGASAQTQIAYLGSGGCDGEDVGCVGGGDAEHTIQAVEISRDGQITPRPDLAIPTGGQPVWLTKFQRGDKQCMFVTRADLDDVQSYVFDASGKATVVGAYKSGGVAPVHADVLYSRAPSDSDVLLVANYHGPDDATTSDGAAASSMIINDDCSLDLADVKPHSGSSVIPSRQGGAHVHSFTATPYRQSANEAVACDLGQDKVFSYSVAGDGKLTLSSVIDTAPGAGPRHTAPAPHSPHVYVVDEMGETVTAYEQTQCDGAACLKELQKVSLVAEGQSGEGAKAAEIVMAPDGKTVYATNRGALNTVTVLGVESDGTLTTKQQVDAPAYPRGMTLAFNGGLLLVAGQSKTELQVFRVKPDGTLEAGATTTEGLPPHPAAFLMFESNSVLV